MITGIRTAGTQGLLVELPGLPEVLALHQHLQHHPVAGQTEVIAAGSTVMLSVASPAQVPQATRQLRALRDLTFTPSGGQEREIEVVYDGEDLADVADALGMSTQGVIEWHTGQAWFGAFGGFAPGFTYCTPEETEYAVPRRPSPRTAVPEKSVAVAGGFSGIYPRTSPGGWQLIGRTQSVMWDLHRESPALVAPGDAVRYRQVSPEAVTTSTRTAHSPTAHRPTASAAAAAASASETSTSSDTSTSGAPGAGSPSAALTVTSAGMQVLIQDQGRPGHSDLGVSRAGVADPRAAAQANRLVGNRESAALLESLNGGVQLTAEAPCVLAVAGAETALQITDPDAGTRTPAMRSAFALLPGETLHLGHSTAGLRSYIALRGGIAGETELNSLSADTMSGLGPAPLAAGDTLHVSTADTSAAVGATAPAEPSTLPTPDAHGTITVRFCYGPRDDWFAPEELQRLASQRWEVTQQANRVGLRLAPDPDDAGARPLQRARHDELASEGVQRGSLQMPPEGNPVLFLTDHPVTGGYPVAGVIIPADLSVVGQLRPGDLLQLQPVDPLTLKTLTEESS